MISQYRSGANAQVLFFSAPAAAAAAKAVSFQAIRRPSTAWWPPRAARSASDAALMQYFLYVLIGIPSTLFGHVVINAEDLSHSSRGCIPAIFI